MVSEGDEERIREPTSRYVAPPRSSSKLLLDRSLRTLNDGERKEQSCYRTERLDYARRSSPGERVVVLLARTSSRQRRRSRRYLCALGELPDWHGVVRIGVLMYPDGHRKDPRLRSSRRASRPRSPAPLELTHQQSLRPATRTMTMSKATKKKTTKCSRNSTRTQS